MEHSEGKLPARSADLYFQRWIPTGKPRAAVGYLHGVGGHSGQATYAYLIDHLGGSGHAVYGLDLRGHGRSSGRRGHVGRWQEYLDDATVFLDQVEREQGPVPNFLFGQSLGGLIALEYAMTNPGRLQGVIASAPALALPNTGRSLRPLVKILSPLTPTLTLSPKWDLSAYTRDPQEVAKLEADPLTDPKVTARMAGEFQSAVARVQANAPRLETPVLILLGDADTVTPPQGSREFYAAIAGSDKTLKSYEGGYHQPILDSNRTEVLADVGTWIEEHLSGA